MNIPKINLNILFKINTLTKYLSIRNYANPNTGVLGGALKKKKGKAGLDVEKTVLPVETDPKKLVTYACGTNVYKTGEDIKLGADSDYPSWLWNIRLGPPKPLEELDPDTKEYWKRIRKMSLQRNTRLRKLKKF